MRPWLGRAAGAETWLATEVRSARPQGGGGTEERRLAGRGSRGEGDAGGSPLPCDLAARGRKGVGGGRVGEGGEGVGGGCLGVTGANQKRPTPPAARAGPRSAADLVTASSLPQLASLPLAVGGTLAPPARWAGGAAVEDSWLGRLPRMDGASTPVLSFAPPIVGGFAAPADSPRGTAQLAIDAFGPLRPRRQPRCRTSASSARCRRSRPCVEPSTATARSSCSARSRSSAAASPTPAPPSRAASAPCPPPRRSCARPLRRARSPSLCPRLRGAGADGLAPSPAVDLSPWEHSPPSLASFFMPAAEQAGRATLLPAARWTRP